jgi:hypothetical protein
MILDKIMSIVQVSIRNCEIMDILLDGDTPFSLTLQFGWLLLLRRGIDGWWWGTIIPSHSLIVACGRIELRRTKIFAQNICRNDAT